MTFEMLLNKVKEYNFDDLEILRKAYCYASVFHSGQYRQSGEPYIIHPLNVAYILAELHADMDTLCAGLLHDTLEDTEIEKEDLIKEFNPVVANLVDGVTKLSKMNFSSKQDQNYANTRKIITGITEDVRIIIIKLADRLHNMRTLSYKTAFKQKENALETMEIFVPLAYYIGAYRVKSELEDLSFQYLKPDVYKKISELKEKMEVDNKASALDMLYKINTILNDKAIPNFIKLRTKNIYGIYQRLNEGHKLTDIHDLIALKIMVDEIDNCYRTLGLVHKEYHPINNKFKDYIANPKTNMYQSLHTTVFGPNGRLVQTQIRTFEMDKIDSFGITAYWDLKKGQVRNEMQNDLKNKYQFFKSLLEINKMFGDNQEFVNQVKREVFTDKVYIYNIKGDVIELPKGSTIIDFAYKISPESGNSLVGAFVNDTYVSADYVLKNKDRVRIITDELSLGPKEDWINHVKTSNAQKIIREYRNK